MLSRRTWRMGHVLAASLVISLPLAVAAQGPMAPGQPPMDPKPMSGLPRVDPQTEPGSLVIRVLRGSFADPGVGLTVKLDLRSADGTKTEQRTAVSVEQGRAVFAGLEAFGGGTALASVDFGGEVVTSQEIRLDPNVGVRMLLVQGARAPAAPEAASDVPRPGVAFANPGQARGTVVVGTLDLGGGRPFSGVEVILEVAKPGLPVEQRKLVSDARGATRFADLGELPPGTTLFAQATLGDQRVRSEPFSLDGAEHGLAVVLAIAGAPQAEAAPQRRTLMTPRAVPTLPAGTVKATIYGPDDRPIGGLEIAVIKLDVTGTKRSFMGEAGPDGVARVEEVALADDSLYQVEVTYKGAPFRSRLFQMGDRMGVTLELRVFPTTGDVSKLRSAVQFGVEALENDQSRVVQLHQAVVEGDMAFWPATPLRIAGPEGANGMVVLDRATVDLQHTEGAPFATLNEPLPPGEVVDMSIAYLMPHRGTLALKWTTPLPVANGRLIVTPGLKLVKGALGPPIKPPHQDGAAPMEFDLYEIGALPVGGSYDLTVEGLVTTQRTFRHLGLGLGLLIALAALLTGLIGPRASLLTRLQRRRDGLLRALDRADATIAAATVKHDPAGQAAAVAERQRLILALDQVYRQIDVLGDVNKARVDVGAAWDRKA